MSAADTDSGAIGKLSPRELEAMRLIAGGLTTKAAAQRMGICIETIKDFTERARFKLGAPTTTRAAVLVALQDKQ
jgi:DNA-binding NarL/FixJ family response regulator